MRTTNLFILRGYVGQEPKAFDNGKIGKVSVATNRSWTDKKSRERFEKTDWVTVTVLNERDAAFVLKNVRKGAPIYAECRVAETSYEKDGKTIYGVDVVANVFDLLSRADSGEEDAAQSADADTPASRRPRNVEGSEIALRATNDSVERGRAAPAKRKNS